MTYLRVRNWDKFQHYKDRNPPWIKNYLELLHDDAYIHLTDRRRALLHGLWILYASSRQVVANDTRTLSQQLSMRVLKSDIEALIQAGFLKVSASKPASKPLAKRYHSRAPAQSQEAETEKETPLPPFPRNGKPPPTTRLEPLRAYAHTYWNDYPNLDVLRDELTDRGATPDQADQIITAEQEAR